MRVLLAGRVILLKGQVYFYVITPTSTILGETSLVQHQ